jgi:hypothetical protein
MEQKKSIMKNVPHWQLLMFIYFALVGVPVYVVHEKLKKKALLKPTLFNLLIYATGVISIAFIMHTVTMWLYFTFFFTVKD